MTAALTELDQLEKVTMRRVILRLVPFLMICYFFALLDRVNVGFAALQMNKDLGLTPAMFGFAASLFFVSYFLVEVPSNLALQKVGARRWIARIMITWGLVTACMAFVVGPYSLYAMRFILVLLTEGAETNRCMKCRIANSRLYRSLDWGLGLGTRDGGWRLGVEKKNGPAALATGPFVLP